MNKVYTGSWSPEIYYKAINLDKHFAKHGDDFGLSGDPTDLVGKQQYVDMAVELINRESGVEKYSDTLHSTIEVYERSTEKHVVGNADGQIATLFKRSSTEIDANQERSIRLI